MHTCPLSKERGTRAGERGGNTHLRAEVAGGLEVKPNTLHEFLLALLRAQLLPQRRQLLRNGRRHGRRHRGLLGDRGPLVCNARRAGFLLPAPGCLTVLPAPRLVYWPARSLGVPAHREAASAARAQRVERHVALAVRADDRGPAGLSAEHAARVAAFRLDVVDAFHLNTAAPALTNEAPACPRGLGAFRFEFSICLREQSAVPGGGSNAREAVRTMAHSSTRGALISGCCHSAHTTCTHIFFGPAVCLNAPRLIGHRAHETCLAPPG